MKGMLLGVMIVLTSLITTGCNTISGIGRDIEKGGQAIEKAAR